MNTVLLILFGTCVLRMGAFLISENRRPQATLAWLLAFTFLPVAGAMIYARRVRPGSVPPGCARSPGSATRRRACPRRCGERRGGG